MAEGQKAAEQTKGVFQAIGDASEDVRKNVNSYLDGVTGNKSVDNDIHPDAKRAGDELSKAATEAGQKISNATDSTKKTT